jgi:HK97 family phage major capsid protein
MSNQSTARELRERHEKLVRDAGDLMGANNTFENDDKRTSFDKLMAEAATVRVQIEDAERAEQHETLARQQLPEHQRTTLAAPGRSPEARATYEKALGAYLRGVPMDEMAAEDRQALRSGYTPLESRDMNTYSAQAGGFLVAPDTRFYGQIIQAMKFFGGLEAAGAEVINTTTAGPMPMSMTDDTANVGAIVPEAQASGHAGGTSPTFTQLVLNGYLYSSKVVKVSWQMLRDSAVDVEGMLGRMLGQRLGRIQNTHMTSTGTGSGMPQGLTTVVTVGRQSATGNTTSVPFDDIYRLIHSVDVAYRSAACKWQFSDASCLVLRLAKDGNGRYLWPELGSVQVGQPGVLAGFNFVINNDMPTMAASAKWATFGDHSYYKIRRIGGIVVVRLNELYAESGQVGFLAYQSADGGYANDGQNPIKALQNSGS